MDTFDRFRSQHTVLPTTSKREGTPVPTAVSIAVNADPTKRYVRTWSTVGKANRMAHDPCVFRHSSYGLSPGRGLGVAASSTSILAGPNGSGGRCVQMMATLDS